MVRAGGPPTHFTKHRPRVRVGGPAEPDHDEGERVEALTPTSPAVCALPPPSSIVMVRAGGPPTHFSKHRPRVSVGGPAEPDHDEGERVEALTPTSPALCALPPPSSIVMVRAGGPPTHFTKHRPRVRVGGPAEPDHDEGERVEALTPTSPAVCASPLPSSIVMVRAGGPPTHFTKHRPREGVGGPAEPATPDPTSGNKGWTCPVDAA